MPYLPGPCLAFAFPFSLLQLELCDKFKVSSFPSIYLGRAADMARANTEALKRWDGQTRTAAGVVAWIAAQQQM
jgi:hypothetical protein